MAAFEPEGADAGFVAAIKEQGQLVPILLRKHPDKDGRYQPAYGRRRIGAGKHLGIKVRAIVKDLSDEQLVPYHDDEYMLRIGRDLLDQQIIDVNGRKVVRVNDVTFDVRKDGDRDLVYILEVDVGIRSIFRRYILTIQGGSVPHRARQSPPGRI